MTGRNVCVVTGFVTKNNMFNVISNLRFQWSFVTITLGKIQTKKYFYLCIFTIVVTKFDFIFNKVGDCYICINIYIG